MDNEKEHYFLAIKSGWKNMDTVGIPDWDLFNDDEKRHIFHDLNLVERASKILQWSMISNAWDREGKLSKAVRKIQKDVKDYVTSKEEDDNIPPPFFVQDVGKTYNMFYGKMWKNAQVWRRIVEPYCRKYGIRPLQFAETMPMNTQLLIYIATETKKSDKDPVEVYEEVMDKIAAGEKVNEVTIRELYGHAIISENETANSPGQPKNPKMLWHEIKLDQLRTDNANNLLGVVKVDDNSEIITPLALMLSNLLQWDFFGDGYKLDDVVLTLAIKNPNYKE